MQGYVSIRCQHVLRKMVPGSIDENPLVATPEGVPLGQGTKSQRKRIEKAVLSHMLVPS